MFIPILPFLQKYAVLRIARKCLSEIHGQNDTSDSIKMICHFLLSLPSVGIMKFFRYYSDRHFHKTAYCNFLLVSVIFIFFILPVSAEAEKPTLTVLNFKSDLNPKTELNPTQLQAVSDQVSSGLGRQGVYKVLDRVSSKERLKEIADQQRGLYDESKTIRASQSLGADKILLGSVTKLGKMYVISAKIVDIGSTQSESQSEEFESLDRITDAVESLVKKFGRKQETVTKKGMLWRSAILPGGDSFTADSIWKTEGTGTKDFFLWAVLFFSGQVCTVRTLRINQPNRIFSPRIQLIHWSYFLPGSLSVLWDWPLIPWRTVLLTGSIRQPEMPRLHRLFSLVSMQ